MKEWYNKYELPVWDELKIERNEPKNKPKIERNELESDILKLIQEDASISQKKMQKLPGFF